MANRLKFRGIEAPSPTTTPLYGSFSITDLLPVNPDDRSSAWVAVSVMRGLRWRRWGWNVQGCVVGLDQSQLVDVDDEYSQTEHEQKHRGTEHVPWTTSRQRHRHQLTAIHSADRSTVAYVTPSARIRRVRLSSLYRHLTYCKPLIVRRLIDRPAEDKRSNRYFNE